MELQTAPLLSIVIPAYNSEKSICRTMDSLLDQSVGLDCYEIILVDDGSTDATLQICREFQQRHSNVRVVHQENLGVSEARNAGIGIARGRWVSFADSDDYVTHQYVETMLATSPQSEWVVFDNYLESGGKRRSAKEWIRSLDHKNCQISQVMPWICDQRLNAPWDKRYSLDVIRQNQLAFPKEMYLGEDLVFNLRYALSIDTVSFSGDAIYVYVDNSLGLTGRRATLEKLKQLEQSYGALCQLCVERKMDAVCRQKLDQSFLRVIARTAGQLYRGGLSCKAIAYAFDQSVMVQSVLAKETSSIKDWIRKYLLNNHLYQVCSVVISDK